MNIHNIKTLGDLKKSGYKSLSVKDELRKNLIQKIRNKENTFPGIIGYEESVIPDTERALLSRHNVLFLGLRGQAKTRIARLLVNPSCWTSTMSSGKSSTAVRSITASMPWMRCASSCSLLWPLMAIDLPA